MFFQPIMSERDLSKFSCSFGVTYMQPSRFLYSSCGVVMSPTTMKSHPSIFAYSLVASVGALIVVVTMALRIFINKEVILYIIKRYASHIRKRYWMGKHTHPDFRLSF